MFPSYDVVRRALAVVIDDRDAQGHAVGDARARLAALPDSYDALWSFARELADLPLRDDWPYVEPDDLDAIWAECDPARPLGHVAGRRLSEAEAAARASSAFLGAVCGCILGKPLEFDPTLADIRAVLEPLGQWPLDDYLTEAAAQAFPAPHPQWPECVRERIRWVAPDDDINYKVIGMLVLEQHGVDFTRADLRRLWLYNLPVLATFGPERTLLLKGGLETIAGAPPAHLDDWVRVLNPADELCGAVIRADAYGYACPGRPSLAAELAWRDAGSTHRRTGVYGAMFIAAAIAAAPVVDDPIAMFELALGFVPRRSRFHAVVADCLAEVSEASDWLDGYERVHGRYAEFRHCQVFQEIGTILNTLRFAESVGDGICKQVMQGNDTDSFGATAGSLLGARFGPGHLADPWVAAFNDEVHLALAAFYEHSLSALAERMGALPGLLA